MDLLKQRLALRDEQIADMRSQIANVTEDSSDLNKKISSLQKTIQNLEGKIKDKDKELEEILNLKEKALNKLTDLESSAEKPKQSKHVEKNPDVATAYIEFYTRTVQSKPMFKKLPEFKEELEPSSPQKLNDIELDEELEKLGLSDVLKKYS
ncbi:hypothetical protein SteCoe_34216 [Stentor coeruleus]|uniref:Uncharacterized protein n=1 Tax=Stentor coeruleus TaxID=5963 RepID=A0A1R2AV02_9CILI|nr:hypothetical protein SteCoe_34216 [Stentor coeruleus]